MQLRVLMLNAIKCTDRRFSAIHAALGRSLCFVRTLSRSVNLSRSENQTRTEHQDQRVKKSRKNKK